MLLHMYTVVKKKLISICMLFDLDSYSYSNSKQAMKSSCLLVCILRYIITKVLTGWIWMSGKTSHSGVQQYLQHFVW
jgi:hypothetical protein